MTYPGTLNYRSLRMTGYDGLHRLCIPLFIMASIEAYTVVTIHLYGGTVHLYGGPLGLVP